MAKYLKTFVCSRCGRAVWAVSQEAAEGDYPVCPNCNMDQRESPEERAKARAIRENANDVFDAFEACRRIAGTRKAVDILLDWAASENRSRIAVDLWDAAVPEQVGARYAEQKGGSSL